MFVSIYMYGKVCKNKQEIVFDEADKKKMSYIENGTSCQSCFVKVQLLWCSSFSSLQSVQYRGRKKYVFTSPHVSPTSFNPPSKWTRNQKNEQNAQMCQVNLVPRWPECVLAFLWSSLCQYVQRCTKISV